MKNAMMKILYTDLRNTFIFLFLITLFISCGKLPDYDISTTNINPREDPMQRSVDDKETFNILNKKGAFLVQKLASYSIQARILHKKKYSLDLSSCLSPVDLALGWGKFLPNPKFDRYYKVSQSGRWYVFRLKQGAPFTVNYFYLHSSNNHIIPANNGLKKLILSLKKGQIVKLQGFLVKISGNLKNGRSFSWQSSLSRDDTGGHSCEVFYVESVQIGDKVFK